MKPVSHAVVSAVSSTSFWYITEWAAGALCCFLSGIRMDLAHILFANEFYSTLR